MQSDDEFTPENRAAAGWLAVTAALTGGRLAPEEGIARLRALQVEHPADAEWLEDEIATIRWTFGLDVAEVVTSTRLGYWDKVLTVTEGLLEERVTPSEALTLLDRLRGLHPEQIAHLEQLMEDIRQSPLWQLLEAE
jgi:hypothetical protein